MTKVFLADDEIAIREGIRNSKIWDTSDFSLVGEASDGEMALSMIRDEQPDILITDVRMPFMDGMKLAAMIARQMPWIEIIILSGYDEFEYARKAMALGVQEYLLKPISSKELLAALERARARRDARQANKLLQKNDTGARFLKEKLLYALLSAEAPTGREAQTTAQLRELGLTLVAGSLNVLDISWKDTTRMALGQDCLYDLMQGAQGKVQCCASRGGTLAVVIGDDEAEAEERAYAFARSAIIALEQLGLGPVLITIGDPVQRIGQLPESTLSARHVRMQVEATRPVTESAVLGANDLGDMPEERREVRALYERLQYATAEDAEQVLRDYALSLGEGALRMPMLYSYLLIETRMVAARILQESGAGDAAASILSSYDQRLASEPGAIPFGEAVDVLQRALEYRQEHVPGWGSTALSRARSFLARNYTNANLMLRDVAGTVGMSDSRFSSVFSQQMGMTFTEYLTTLRMNKAKELLAMTDMRAAQIAAAVGYNDPHYFSYLFRRYADMTPSDYRRQEREKVKQTR